VNGLKSVDPDPTWPVFGSKKRRPWLLSPRPNGEHPPGL